MSFNRIISNVLRPLRFLVIAFACAVLLFANAYPAAAIGSTPTSPKQGSVQLDDIQKKSEEVTKSKPLDLEETESEANKGINEIQGDSDAGQMYNPENSQGTSVEERVKGALERVTGK